MREYGQSQLEMLKRAYINTSILKLFSSMMNGDIVKKTFRLCLLLVVNSVVRELYQAYLILLCQNNG